MKDKELPPQDAYNAGQKIYSYFVVLCTLGIMITGPVMVFKSLFPPIVKQIAQPIHFVCVFTIVAWLFIHVYMGAVFPEEKEAFFSMFSGKVSAWYARAHHEKWYNEKLKEEMEWEDKVEQEVLQSEHPQRGIQRSRLKTSHLFDEPLRIRAVFYPLLSNASILLRPFTPTHHPCSPGTPALHPGNGRSGSLPDPGGGFYRHPGDLFLHPHTRTGS